MEDRIRALETELNTLKTTLNTSKWWLGVFGAFLIGGLGVTNFFAIPSFINSAFVEKGGKGLIDKITASEKSATESSAILKSAAGTIGEFEPIEMYKCPYNTTDVIPGAFASFGCLGQYSSTNSCSNLSWSGGYKTVSKPCDAIVLFKKK
jgi:hypothetical protein